MKAGRLVLLGLLFCFIATPLSAQSAPENFVVQDIRLEGLQRISDGTVFSYLELEEGEELTTEKARQAIRNLYDTGFFHTVVLERDGQTLVIRLSERPTIARISITGNSQIETEALRRAMRDQGIDEGRVLNEQLVEQLEQELFRTYYARGRYGVSVEVAARELEANQVALSITIAEGRVATIRRINLVGNETFDDDELKAQFELVESGFWTFFSSNDQYSREKLTGDLESLRSYYMNKGYAGFEIRNVQVALSPDRRDVFLTINVSEGDVYTVDEVELIGDFPVPKEQLEAFVQLSPGETYSLAKANRTSDFISQRLGASGYAHAEVSPDAELDHENQTAKVRFYVEPGQRIYVREIRVRGTSTTADKVYRREMRQFERAPLSNALVERSRVRLQRLPFVQQVNLEEVPADDASDMVDLEIDVRERNFGEFQVGVGYGGFAGLSAQASVQNNNLFGLGHRGSMQLRSNQLGQFLNVSHTDPYASPAGVARTVGFSYESRSGFARGQSRFSTTSFGFNLMYGLPISEFETVRYGVRVNRNEYLTNAGTSDEIRQFVNQHGDQFTVDGRPGSRMDSAELNLAWVRDTRNRALFATRGGRTIAGVDVAVPGLDLEYWTARLSQESFLPLGGDFTLRMDGEIAYGEPYGDQTFSLPPGQQVFAGGPQSVRGYESARLSPLDSNNRPYGGALKVNLQNELILPNFFAEEGAAQSNNYRFYLFLDAGYAWPDLESFDSKDFRYSPGVGASWLTPMGLLRFSYAEPVNVRPEDRNRNIIDRFQIDLGGTF